MNSRRKLAQNFSAFSAAIASPASIDVTPYAWPANCRMAISYNQDLLTGEATVLITGPYKDEMGDFINREFAIPALLAGVIHKLDYIERGREISYTSSVPGKMSIYVLDAWNRPFVVAHNP